MALLFAEPRKEQIALRSIPQNPPLHVDCGKLKYKYFLEYECLQPENPFCVLLRKALDRTKSLMVAHTKITLNLTLAAHIDTLLRFHMQLTTTGWAQI